MQRFQLRSNGNFSIDIPIFLSTLVLCVIGIMFIYSSSITATGELRTNEYLRQIFWLIPGIAIMVGAALVDYKSYKDSAVYIFAGGILLLLMTLIFGQVVYGGRRWLGAGGIGFQPSELVKIAYILFLAWIVEKNRDRLQKPIFLGILFLITLLPIGLILVQPDLGTATVFVPIFIVILFVAGANIWFILFFVGALAATVFFAMLPAWMQYVAQREVSVVTVLQQPSYAALLTGSAYIIAAVSAIGFFLLKKRLFMIGIFLGTVIGTGIAGGYLVSKVLREYQMMRLIVFMNPNIDPRGAGWNILQSLTAVGSGGITGKGFLLGTHSHYQYIPQQTTDFIFSIIAEEWGFIGALFVFGLFFIILVRSLVVMHRAKDGFGAYICAGVAAMIFYQFIVNTGMAIGMMPITGLPLPFVSYGGTSLWTSLLAVGLIQSVYRHRYTF